MGAVSARHLRDLIPSSVSRATWPRRTSGSGLRRHLPIALTATCALLTATTAFADPLTLTGNYLQVGISDYGTFGSDGSTEPGLLHDPTGTRNFYPNGIANDYLTPGDPHDGFAINSTQTGFIINDNSGASSFGTTSPTLLTGAAAQGYSNAATWTSTYGTSLSITNSYFFNDGDERIKVVSTVTALTDLTDVAFGRSEDPDPDVDAYGDYSTVNTRGDATTAPQDLVSAAGANTGLTIGILNGSGDTYVHNTAISTDCCDNSDPYTVIANTDTLAYPTTNSGDYGLQMAWQLGDIAAGQSLTVVYDYVFGTNQGSVSTGGGPPAVIDTTDGDISPSVFSLGSAAATASTVMFDGGTLQLSGGTFANNIVTAPVIIDANNGTIDTSTGNGGFSGLVSGPGSLTIMGGGTFSLTAANTFAGGTFVEASAVAVGDNAALGTGTVTLNGGTLQALVDGLSIGNAATLTGSSTIDTQGYGLTYAGVISGTGGLAKIGTGTLVLSAANSYSGGTALDAGTIAVGDNAALGTGTVTFNGGGLQASADGLTIGNAANLAQTGTIDTNGFGLTYSGSVSGSGGLVKAGIGTLTLTSANSYLGGTTIDAGTLAVADGAALGPGAVTFNGGGLQAAVGGLTIGNGAILSRNGTIDTNGFSLTYAGNISGAGGLVKTGTGTLLLSAANSYTGGTTISGGTLQFAGTGGSTILSFGTGDLTLAGGTLQAAAQNGSNSGLIIGNGIKIGAAGGYVDINGNSFTLSGNIVDAITPAGQLTITNSTAVANVVTLSGTNSYTGGTAITGPTVVLAGARNALGAGALQLGANSSFLLGGFDQRVTRLTGTGTFANLGTFTADVTNTLTVQSGSFGGVIEDGVSGGFQGTTALTKVSDGSTAGGTLLLSGTDLYSGATTVAGGTLKTGSATAFSPSSALTVAAGAIFDLNGFSTGFRSLAGNGTVTNDGKAAAILTIGAQNTDPATTTIGFAGTLADGTAPLALVKTGTGTLALSGTNTYSGGTLLQTGTLAIGAAGALGTNRLDMAENTTLAFTSSLTALNDILFLAPAGGTTATEAAAIPADPTFDTGSNTDTLAGTISGPGSLTKIGSGTLILTGTETYTGATTVAAGTLEVDGSTAASATTVNGGATLSGIGTVGSITARNGATVAPGTAASPYGVLHTSGSAAFFAGATYQVNVSPTGQTSALAVNGTASLGGAAVTVVSAAGTANLATRVEILTATGGIQGQFGSLSTATALAFLNPTLSYSANAVTLAFQSNGTSFTDIALTPNEMSVAGAIQSLDPNSVIVRSLQGLSQAQARVALDQLAGATHASVATTATQDARRVSTQILDRLWNIGGGEIDARTLLQQLGTPGELPAFVNCYAPLPAPAPRTPPSIVTAWGEGFGDFGHDGGDRNGAGLDRSLGGFIIGYDMPLHGLGAPTRVGIAGGYTNTSFSGSGSGGSGSNGTFESVFGSIYGGARYGAIDIRGGVTAAGTSTTVDRTVAYPGFLEGEHSVYGGNTEQVFAELGYRFSGTRWVVEPVVNAAYTHVHQDDFHERGGAAALFGFAQDNDVGTTTLGARGEYAPFVGIPLVARAFLGWRHGFGDIDPATKLAFEAGSIPFTSQGAAIDRNALASEFGLDWRYSAATTLGLAYTGQVGPRDSDNGLKGRLEYKF